MTQNPGSEDPIIWICASYWKSPLRLKRYSTPPPGIIRSLDTFLPHGGLLLHEFTHAWYASKYSTLHNSTILSAINYKSLTLSRALAADVKQREGALKGKIAYNHEYCLRLLREANGMARTRNNAHTYAIFAAAVTLDRSTWSIDPDRMTADRDLRRRAHQIGIKD